MSLKKSRIIEEWLRDSTQSLEQIAFTFDTTLAYVSYAISAYIENLALYKPLYLAPSMNCGDYFLFDEVTERRVKIKSRTITNPEDFSNKEIVWLKANLNVGIEE